MTRRNFEQARRNEIQRSETRRQHFQESTRSWSDINRLEQRRFRSLAEAHAHAHQIFASIAEQAATGRPITQKQAKLMMEIATERGWSTTQNAKNGPRR